MLAGQSIDRLLTLKSTSPVTPQERRNPIDVNRFLRDAELSAERLSSIVRLVIFFALLILVLASGADHHHERFALAVVSAYGLVAIVALILAWQRLFHPVVPYAYVTFDVALVCLGLLLTSRMLDFPPHMVFAIPASGIIFVVLAHAAMRFRPDLVVYAGSLTTAVLAVGVTVMPKPDKASPFLSGTQHGDLLQSLLHSRLMPFGIVALATLALWATSRRTSRMLQRSVDYSRRLVTLSRFFSPRLADRLASEGGAMSSSGRRQCCAIMFIDICGFTEIARDMDPEALSGLLADFRGVVTGVIFEHAGMVDKFIGDAVLAVFGAFQAEADDAARAIQCGFNVLDAVQAWSVLQRARGEPDIRIGIGAHYGEVFVGAVGNDDMLEFTVLGDTVNVAERLERLTRVVDGAFVVSRDILDAAGSMETHGGWAPVTGDFLKGRVQDVVAFSWRPRS
jgi:Adenylate cyclase, family 3 (some proteins contain HAMP domain)